MNRESDETQKLERLGKILGRVAQETPSGDFDRRFWARFETLGPTPLRQPSLPARLVFHPKFLGTLATISLMAVFFVFALDQPHMDVAQGKIERTNQKGIAASIEHGEHLRKGDTIRTDKAEWAILELKNGYRFKMHPGTELKVLELKPVFRPGQTVFHLVRGEVFISIGDEGERKYPIKVITPNAFAAATGTQFSVSHEPSSRKRSVIRVIKGAVEAGCSLIEEKEAIASVSVHKGHELVVKDRDWPLKPYLIPSRTLAKLKELFQFSKADQAILIISMSSKRVSELLEPCALYLRYTSGSRDLEPINAIVKEIQAASRDDDSARHFEAARDLEAMTLKQNTIDRVPVLLFIGAYYSYIDRHEEAARVFETVASRYTDSSFRSVALLAAARIYSEKLRETQKAHTLAKIALSEYPYSYEKAGARAIIKK